MSAKTFVIISSLKMNTSAIKQKIPHSRWIQYYNSEEGLAAITLFNKRILGVFVSYDMSFLNGLEVQRIIKKQYATLPVIIMYPQFQIMDFFNNQNEHSYVASYSDFIYITHALQIQKPFLNSLKNKT